MLFFNFKKPKTGTLDNLRKNITNAFSKVREDTTVLYQWIDHLSTQNQQLKTTIDDMRRELKLLPKTDEEIRSIVDKYYSFEHLFNRLEEVENRILSMERGVSRRLEIPQKTIIPKTESRQKLQETIAKRISKNSKEYIKNILTSLISKYENVAGPQLKEMVVEEQKLCSKSSFYRLLEELENDEKIGVISSGKLKYFTTNLSTKNGQ
ncbi:hypothetical protein HZA97_05895 [Candidatus Woesearchaeota archaeon]|nr:hypothetical protein [Candidatus Woesearchaeota archaeon]